MRAVTTCRVNKQVHPWVFLVTKRMMKKIMNQYNSVNNTMVGREREREREREKVRRNCITSCHVN